jgi:hypothetical protein
MSLSRIRAAMACNGAGTFAMSKVTPYPHGACTCVGNSGRPVTRSACTWRPSLPLLLLLLLLAAGLPPPTASTSCASEEVKP